MSHRRSLHRLLESRRFSRRVDVPFFSTFYLQRQFSNKFSFTMAPKVLKNLTAALPVPVSTTTVTTTSGEFEDYVFNKTDYGYDIVGDDNFFGDEFFNSLDGRFNATDISKKFSHKFDAPEYGVFAAVLLLSCAIGVFYGCFGNGQNSTDEYLIANRKMPTIPAALSLLSSYVSAITILGNPVEIYYYGSSYGLIVVSFIPLVLSLAYLYIPVFHNLGLSSAYEYFEIRFNRTLRTVVSLVNIAHYIIYMSIIIYGPALAIGQVTGISTRLSTAIIFIACVFYSTLGGLKGVIMTDALQAIIMTGSLVAIVIISTNDLGGFEAVWKTASKFERTDFFNFDLDPRARHTFWTAIIGGYLQWLPLFAATQSQVQRYLSMRSLTCVRRALVLNLLGFAAIFGLGYWVGLAIFAKYHDCDPVQTGMVTKPDQLLPLFVMDSLGDYPGLPGLFVGGITCASMSSVSTGLNALSATVTYDFLKEWMPLVSDGSLLRLSKAFCVIFGCISFGFIFLAENVGNILPGALTLTGIVLGPTLGLFSLGMFFPWANSRGCLLGFLASLSLMLSLVMGNHIVTSENLISDPVLPGLTTAACGIQLTENFQNASINIPLASYFSQPNFMLHEVLVDVFSISYMWYPGIGFMLTIVLGLFFSIMLRRCDDKPRGVNPDHLSPPLLAFWVKFFPSHALKWFDIEAEDYPMMSSSSSAAASSTLRSTNFSFRKESVCDMKLKRVCIASPPVTSTPIPTPV